MHKADEITTAEGASRTHGQRRSQGVKRDRYNTLENREKRQEAKDPLYHPEAKAQRGQADEREAKRRQECEREGEGAAHA